jgi:hypothetical protein
MKYTSPSTYHSKDVAKVKGSQFNTKVKVKSVGPQGKVLSKGTLV